MTYDHVDSLGRPIFGFQSAEIGPEDFSNSHPSAYTGYPTRTIVRLFACAVFERGASVYGKWELEKYRTLPAK